LGISHAARVRHRAGAAEHGAMSGIPIGAEGAGSAVAVAPAPESLLADRSRPVMVTGAAGFVGAQVCAELSKAGLKVRAFVRSAEKAARRLATCSAELVVGDIRDREAVTAALHGAGAVIHLAAIAVERTGESYEQVNTEATATLLDAARDAGADRVVHMSQNGAAARSPHRFLRSKGIAEALVRQSGLRWTVLRPSVIFGPDDEFANVLARLVRLSPLIFPLPGGGTARFQPIAVADVARATRLALENESTVGGVYALGGPAALTLRQMTERILLAMDAHRMLVSIPVAALRPLVALAQRILPRPPVTTGLLDLLAEDNTIQGTAIHDVFGITPSPFAAEEIRYLKRIGTADAIRSLFRD
ncbi:MAG: complex I NDUFA9 subunit family protein, partial [Gemmatimonadaceae bacterium]